MPATIDELADLLRRNIAAAEHNAELTRTLSSLTRDLVAQIESFTTAAAEFCAGGDRMVGAFAEADFPALLAAQERIAHELKRRNDDESAGDAWRADT